MAFESKSDDGSLPLPEGGGAQSPTGQDFQVDLATGSGSYRIPFGLPVGPRQIRPELALVYGTGYGNGICGPGWVLPLPTISRSAIDGQPAYDDAVDTFSYGGQPLVDVGGGRFRPAVEKDFQRIERAGEGWLVRSKDGSSMRFGPSAATRIELPVSGPDPTVTWLLAEQSDPAGNTVTYQYDQQDGQALLSEVAYGPYRVQLTYENRPDIVRSTTSGVVRQLTVRLSAVRLVLDDGVAHPVKEYRLGYESSAHTWLSRLVRVTLVALDDAGTEDATTPLLLHYSDVDPTAATLKPVRSDSPLPGAAETSVFFADLEGDGLAGMMQLSATGGYYWPNHGNLRLGQAQRLQHFPSALVDSPERVRLASLSGHGLIDLVVMAGRAGGFFPLRQDGTWDTFRAFVRPPALPLTDARTRFVDLDFDGQADLLYADDRAFYAVLNRGGGDFENPRVLRRVHDRAAFPDVDLASPSVHLADMTGDGGADLVEVRESLVTYWPNLGLGRFGPAVVMADSPRLPPRFDPALMFLVDVDGDGLTDVVHVGPDSVTCWFNRSGIGFSPPVVIDRTPPAAPGQVMTTSLTGNGCTGLLWAGGRPLGTPSRHFYLDVAGPHKAHLLTRIQTPTGADVQITYDTAVTEAVADRGTSDAGFVPFPIQVVRRIEATDINTGSGQVTEYAYHRGHYDARMRRFNGFGRVEQIDRGGIQAPDRITVSQFHTTPPSPATDEALERHFVVARLPFRTTVFGADDPTQPFWIEDIEAEAVQVDTGVDGTPVWFASRRRLHRTITERGATSIERDITFSYDAFGNVLVESEARRWTDPDGTPRASGRSIETQYAQESQAHLVGVPVQTIERDLDGSLLAAARLYYDGPDFRGLPFGSATRGIMTRREALAFTDSDVTEIYGADIPDLPALGYRHVDDPVLGGGWWFDEVAQRPDAVGNPDVRRDPLGRDTTFTFNAFGIHPVKMVNPLGQVITQAYDLRHGQQTELVNRDGQTSRWVYDLHGRLLSLAGPQDPDDEPSVVYEHFPSESPPRLLIKQRSEFGGTTFERRHRYTDARNQEIQVRVELGGGEVAVIGHTTAWTRLQPIAAVEGYLASSTAYSISDAPTAAKRSTTRRDAQDRPIELTDPSGLAGRLVHEPGIVHHFDANDLDPSSLHVDTPRSEFKDPAGQLVAVQERLDSASPAFTTRYHRNGAGLLLRVVDQRGERTLEQRFDRAGRVVQRSHRDAARYTFVIDAAGNVVSERRGDRRLFRTYDELNRVTALHYADPASVARETYSYDTGAGDNLPGRLARVVGDFGSVEYSYSLCGRLRRKRRTFVDRPGETHDLSYSYDPLGRTRSVTYPDGTVVDLGYDGAGRPVTVSGVIEAVDFDPSGHVSRLQFVNGVQTTYEYGPVPGRLAEIRTGPAGGDSYQHLRFGYDPVGNPLRIDDLATVAGHVRDNRRYDFDALYRLVGAQGRDAGGTYQHSYDYDELGNLLTRPEEPGGLTLDYDGMRLTAASDGATYDYDDLGNLTADDGWEHSYDDSGRLVESTAADGTRVETVRDHTGTRVTTRVHRPDGTVEVTSYCDDAFVFAPDGTTETYLFHNNNRVAVRRSDGTAHAIHADALGNPASYSDLTTGAFSGQLIFYPYGGVAVSMLFGASARYLFGKHPQVPGTGLSDFGMRVYSPRLGRFLQPDPAMLNAPDDILRMPRGQHLYGYVIGNPAVLVDPHGAFSFDEAGQWLGDFFRDVGEAGGDAIKAVGQAVGDFFVAVGNAVVAAGTALWEGLKWVANAAWEVIKWVGQALAFVITWTLAILDFAVTWLNPLTWLVFGLDQIDHPLANALSFVIKFLRSPMTTTVGIGIGLYGLATGKVQNVAFKKGMIVFEWDPEGDFSGTTLGGTVHLWSGNTSDVQYFNHEVYHSNQYVGWGDMFIPAYVVGGLSGLLTSAMAGDPHWRCFFGVSDNYTFGQPLEMGGELVKGSGNCS